MSSFRKSYDRERLALTGFSFNALKPRWDVFLWVSNHRSKLTFPY